MTAQREEGPAVFVGIDWGSESHQICIIDGRRKVLLEALFPHSGSGLEALRTAIMSAAGNCAEGIAVAIEQPRGPIVETLLEHDIAVFSINPKQLDRFRDRHSASGAKDDRKDAFVLADSLRTDMPAFRRARLGEPVLIQLRELSRMQEELKAERIALGNRLRAQLHRYYPQILELDNVHEARWLWALLELAPTPQHAKKVSLAKIQFLLKKHRIRSLRPEQVKERLTEQPLHVAPGVTEATSRHVGLLIPRLRLVHEQKLEVEREIESVLEALSAPVEGRVSHSDASLLQSLPGLGPLVCATMLSEASESLANRDYARLRVICGVAPVTKRSGKQYSVEMRRACSGRLRTAVHYWIGNTLQRDPHCKARYASLRAAGHSHGRALRGVGDRMLAILVAVLKTGTPYTRHPASQIEPAAGPVTAH